MCMAIPFEKKKKSTIYVAGHTQNKIKVNLCKQQTIHVLEISAI